MAGTSSLNFQFRYDVEANFGPPWLIDHHYKAKVEDYLQ